MRISDWSSDVCSSDLFLSRDRVWCQLDGHLARSRPPPDHETAASVLLAGNLARDYLHMTFITAKDGAQIFYKDWGPKGAQTIVFHHGWPLSADDWDNQMMFFLGQGYRVIAHDRRGHGRSSQTSEGNDMDTYASDVVDMVERSEERSVGKEWVRTRRSQGAAI